MEANGMLLCNAQPNACLGISLPILYHLGQNFTNLSLIVLVASRIGCDSDCILQEKPADQLQRDHVAVKHACSTRQNKP